MKLSDDFGSDPIIRKKIEQFCSAVGRLEEVVGMQGIPEDVKRDSMIQRFEFSFELAWKTLKAILTDEGMATVSPKQTLRSAFAAGLLGEHSEVWLRMLVDRNQSSHLYSESLSKHIVQNITCSYVACLKELSVRLGGKP